MLKTWKQRFVLIGVFIAGLIAVPSGIAFALCEATSGSEGADIVICTGEIDKDGIDTSWGKDVITVQLGAEVGGGIAIDAGGEDDVVYNYGVILPAFDAIHMRSGNAEVFNYGRIGAGDDGIWCVLAAGETCTITNYGTITANNETVDLRNEGGVFRLYNEGWIRSYEQEALHLFGGPSNLITNYGTIYGWKSAMETHGGQLTLTNYGEVISEHEMAVNAGSENDVIVNYGMIQSNYWLGIGTSSGADTVTNFGTVTARNSKGADAVIELGAGDDTLITSGDIIENWMGERAVKAGFGNDTVIVQGGVINKPIDGGTEEDGGEEHDVLIFAFKGTQEEIDAFTKQVATLSPMGGIVVWRNATYQWEGFEEIQLALVVE